MAIYHLHVKNISRGDGRSAVAAAAYRAGETLPNEAEERDSAFGGRRDVLFTAIRPPAGAPAWMTERATLWNAVEKAEKRKDARLAKEIEFALPRELTRDQWAAVALEMADAYASRGHVADVTVHSDALGENPHVHLLLTTRTVTAEGFGGKMRDADTRAFVKDARALWAKIANAALGKAGAGVEIDARSNAARGIEQEPTSHRGPDREERRARKERAAEQGIVMKLSPEIEARRQEVAEQANRFPAICRRPDWPPATREPPADAGMLVRLEWQRFWREVDTRPFEDRGTVQDDAPQPSIIEKVPDPRVETAVNKARASADVYAFADTSPAGLKEWDELEKALHDQVRAAGHEPGQPTDWQKVLDGMSAMRAQIADIRAQAAENAALRARLAEIERKGDRTLPVPGPNGELLAATQREVAEDAMLRQVEGTSRANAPAPRPEKVRDNGGRAAARAAVDRQNAIDVPDREADAYRIAPHERDLDWLYSSEQPRHAAVEAVHDDIDDLDWLKDRPREREPERDIEPERERER